MGDTAIEWTDKTWNPVVGCTKVSPGCKNQRHKARAAGKAMPKQYARPFEVIQVMPDRLTDPLSWRKPARVFVNSVSDLFHEDVPDEFIDKVFATMGVAHWHTFQVLTKRPERMAAYFAETYQVPARPAGFVCGIDVPAQPSRTEDRWSRINAACDEIRTLPDRCWNEGGELIGRPAWPRRPLPNVWLGTSCENQAAADERIPHLLRTPAAVRFLSCEPLLSAVDLRRYLVQGWCPECRSSCFVGFPEGRGCGGCGCVDAKSLLGWVIVGGESGPGSRPCNVEWVRSLVAQCKAAGVACFVKQLGASPVLTGAHAEYDARELWSLSDKKGGDWSEWPAELRIREFPTPAGAH